MRNATPMTVDELRAQVDAGDLDTVVVAFTDHYGKTMGKRFDAQFFADTIDEGTHACDYLLTCDMEMEPVDGFEFANWAGGYGDVHLVPDLATLRPCAWEPGTAMVLCDVIDDADHSRVDVAPRTMLRRQVERLSDAGFVAQTASELEFFLYRESYRDAHAKGYTDLDAAGWYNEDYSLLQASRVEDFVGPARRALRDSGVPVENSKGEAAVGQHELNVRYTDALTMADRHVVLKQALKEIADQQGVAVTFMAKPHADQSGNSCHIHLSLWDEGGNNAFVDEAGETTDEFRWFLGGWMHHLRDLMVMYAPTINSYKRYQSQSWAPTSIAWSADNRTAGFRIVGTGQSTRIECRIPGADVNPYLAYAAALASGLDGIERKIEPPTELVGDAYTAGDVPKVATSLREALDEFGASDAAKRLLGDGVVAHYHRHLTNELQSYRAAVTDWERNRYFERI